MGRDRIFVYPPFFTDLFLKIDESLLLHNYVNVHRLEIELVELLVSYLGIIRISLEENQPGALASFFLGSQFDSMQWLSLLKSGCFCDVKSSQNVSFELLQIISRILHTKIENPQAIKEFGSVISESPNIVTVYDLLEFLCLWVKKSAENFPGVEVCKALHPPLFSLLEMIFGFSDDLFAYRVCYLSSFVVSDQGIENFFRAGYGLNWYPFSVKNDKSHKIGNVWLMMEVSYNEFLPVLCLSPWIFYRQCQEQECRQGGYWFFRSHHKVYSRYESMVCGHEIQEKTGISELLGSAAEDGFRFYSENEELYYRKLLSYWEDGVIDDEEEQAIRLMHRIFNLSIERMREIEKHVQQELGIMEVGTQVDSIREYRKLYKEFSQNGEIGPLERMTLQQMANQLGLRSHEIREIELDSLVKRAKAMMVSKDLDQLTEVLVQVALVDFQNSILEKARIECGVDISNHHLIVERNQKYKEYLTYLQIVYADQVVTTEERRFLDLQRRRLGLSEEEAYELELLEDRVMRVLDQEQDELYEMQQENFKVGGILLAQGVVTESQLDHALTVQKRDKGTKLGAVLYELGYITPDQLKSCLDLQRHLYFKKDSYRLGTIALRFALIDQKKLRECLTIQDKFFKEQGITKKLGDLLLERGFLSRLALDFILSIQNLSREF